MLKRADWQSLQVEVTVPDASGEIQLAFSFYWSHPLP